MRCPGCGRNIQAGRERCLYCGAGAPKDSDAVESDATAMSGATAIRQKGEKVGAVFGAGEREEVYFRLNDLPETLRQKVEEALTRGQPSKPGTMPTEEYIDQQLALLRSQRRVPMDKLSLTLIFFCSMALVGFIVWLLS